MLLFLLVSTAIFVSIPPDSVRRNYQFSEFFIVTKYTCSYFQFNFNKNPIFVLTFEELDIFMRKFTCKMRVLPDYLRIKSLKH